MKNIHYYLFLFTLLFLSCSKSDAPVNVNGIGTQKPSDINVDVIISTDESGIVKITPTAKNANSFKVFFGDSTNEKATLGKPGVTLTHTYGEGDFILKVIAVSSTGLETEFTKKIKMVFKTPEKLVVTVTKSKINTAKITVAATADYAASFKVFFGVSATETATPLAVGASVDYVYTAIGDYTVKVVAKGIGAATIEKTETVNITELKEAPTLPIDFESETVSYGFANFGEATAERVDNPEKSGINTSNKIGKLTKATGAETWAGTTLELPTDIDFTTNTTFKVKVYAPKSNITVKLKIENATESTINKEVDATYTTMNDWQELSFDFSGIDKTKTYAKVVFFFDFGVVGDGAVYYFDDVKLVASEVSVVTDPTTAPPVPTLVATDVISMFSDTYTDVTVDTWRTTWSQGSTLDETIAFSGNAVKKYSDVNFFGVEAATTVIDASQMTYFHIDVWSDNFTTLKIKLVDFGANGVFGAGNGDTDNVEHEITKTGLTKGTWVSLDIPLSEFTGLTTKAHIAQLVISAEPSGTTKLYIDNVYFRKGEVLTTPPLTLPIDFESTTINYEFTSFGSATAERVDNPEKSGINTSDKIGKLTKVTGAETWAGTTLQLPTNIDFTTNTTFKAKVYAPKSNITVKLKIENATETNTNMEVDATYTTMNIWQELSFDFSGIDKTNTYAKVVIFFDFGNAGDDSVYYFDDIKLVAGGVSVVTDPTTAPTVPTVAAANVISMFSDTYTDVTVDTWRTNWSTGSTLDETIAFSGNAVKKYSDVNFFGVETTTIVIDASQMTHFHIDVWSDNFTTLKIKLVDFGANGVFGAGNGDTDNVEHEITKTGLATGSWVSLDIPLSEFTGLTTKAHIAQLIISAEPSGTARLYIDNVYFKKGTVVTTTPLSLPIGFESTTVNYQFRDFEGAVTEKIENPQKNGINITNNVVKFTKSTSTQTAAGTEMLTSSIDFSTNTTFKLKVYSPKSGITVKLKLENAVDSSKNNEKDATTTTMNAWEEVSFDFSTINKANTYEKIILFFDFGNAGDDSVYYFDDIKLVAGEPVVIPAPTTAPPVPTLVATDVISMFSDTYTDVAVDTWRTTWSTGSTLDETIAFSGNAVKKYSDVNVFGVATTTTIIDASQMTHFHIDVWSDNFTTLKIKLVDFGANGVFGTDGNADTDNVEHEITRTGLVTGSWVSLDIPLSEFTGLTTKAHIAQLIISAEPSGTARLYIDNVYFRKGTVVITPPLTLPIGFESATINYEFTSFGSATAERVDNPEKSGINTSDKIGKLTKVTGADTWAGTTLQLPTNIDFTTNTTFKVKVYAPKSNITVKLKIENATETNTNMEVDATYTTMNVWQELSFDFSGIDKTNTYAKVVIFFDFGNAGDDSVYYFDDIKLVAGVTTPPLTLPIDFESATINYVFTSFGSATAEKIDNPEKLGINTTNKIGKLTKVTGADTWAGTTLQLPTNIDFTTNTTFKVKVYAPKSNITVKLKIENATETGTNMEVDAIYTTMNVWQELSFDFSTIDKTKTYVKVVLFFDFGVAGDGAVYYFDDIKLVAGVTIPPLALPIDFESTTVNYQFRDFEGAVTEKINNPEKSGINTTDKVVKFTKSTSTLTAAGTEMLTTSIDFSTNTTFKVKVYSPKNGITVKLKLENAVDSSKNNEKDATTTTMNAWEEVSFDFSMINKANTYEKIILFFDFGNAGDDSVYYFDDIKLVAGTPVVVVPAPTTAPSVPTVVAGNVISMFSDTYTDVAVDTWRTTWSQGSTLDETIAFSGNAVKKYSDVNYFGVETTTTIIDASQMTHFHIDVWSDNFTTLKIKLVDFGANGVFGAGVADTDNVEHEITRTGLATGSWVSLDIPLSEFTGLTTKAHIAQLIISAEPSGTTKLYIDNVYFHK